MADTASAEAMKAAFEELNRSITLDALADVKFTKAFSNLTVEQMNEVADEYGNLANTIWRRAIET